jgi:hypothetical protein
VKRTEAEEYPLLEAVARQRSVKSTSGGISFGGVTKKRLVNGTKAEKYPLMIAVTRQRLVKDTEVEEYLLLEAVAR